jgi:hypothetical protein
MVIHYEIVLHKLCKSRLTGVKEMKLWILKAKEEFTGYIKNQNVVVRAETEKEARGIATASDGMTRAWIGSYATCEELLPDGEEGVVIVDNNGA